MHHPTLPARGPASAKPGSSPDRSRVVPARGMPSPGSLGRTFSTAQVSVMLSRSTAWVRANVPRTGDRYREDDLRAWLHARAVSPGPVAPVLELVVSPAGAAQLFAGSGSAKVWWSRMQSPLAAGLDPARVFDFAPGGRVAALSTVARLLEG